MENKSRPTAETIRHLRHQIESKIPEVEKSIQRSGQPIDSIPKRTKIAEAVDRLRQEYESGVDPLTGLLNLKGYQRREKEALEAAKSHNHPLTVTVVDVNDLKVKNDREGHDAGDAYLKRVAQLLRDSTRITDVVARVGGDEFRLLLTETDKMGAAAWKIRVENLFRENNISASIGAVEADVNNMLQSVKAADTEMYKEKRRHKRENGPVRKALKKIIDNLKPYIQRK